MNIPALVILLLVAVGIIAVLTYSHKRQRQRQTTRTDDELKAYREILMQSPDNELSEEDAAFVRTLFTPALKGQYDPEARRVARQMRRLDNQFFKRALGIKLVERWRLNNPNTDEKFMPPDLRELDEVERRIAPEQKPQPLPKVTQ